MEIVSTFLVRQPKKFLSKKSTIQVSITREEIIYYFENKATPYDLKYIYQNRNNNDELKIWLQKIILSDTKHRELKSLEILQVTIDEYGIGELKAIIKEIANKKGFLY